jgi:hypothetical protein
MQHLRTKWVVVLRTVTVDFWGQRAKKIKLSLK